MFLSGSLKRPNSAINSTNTESSSFSKLNDSIKRLSAPTTTIVQPTTSNNIIIEPKEKIQKLSTTNQTTTFNDKSASELLSELYKLDPNNAQGYDYVYWVGN